MRKKFFIIVCLLLSVCLICAIQSVLKKDSGIGSISNYELNSDEVKKENNIKNDIVSTEGELISIQDDSELYEGISFIWDKEKQTCCVWGTAENNNAYNNIIDNKKNLPNGITPGDCIIVRFETKATKKCNKKNIEINSVFYDKYGNVIEDKSLWYDLPLIIPQNAIGWTLRLKIRKGATVDSDEGYVSRIQAFKLQKKRMDVPLIVSFVDDDTANEDAVWRYHEACCHNGIIGNYAVITEHLNKKTICKDALSRKEELLKYQDEGFGMLIHAYKQSYGKGKPTEWTRVPRTKEDMDACRENLNKGIKDMEEAGFTNFKFWITPGGHHEEDLVSIAKQLGLNCLISTQSRRENTLMDFDRWHIKRVSLGASEDSKDSLEKLKKYVDDCVLSGSGWLIITTHFEDGWSKLEGENKWDETLDEKGYSIGYKRFNEMVDYVKSKGMVPMTIPEAWSYYEPIINDNLLEIQRN